jgi:hypothetical protein
MVRLLARAEPSRVRPHGIEPCWRGRARDRAIQDAHRRARERDGWLGGLVDQ